MTLAEARRGEGASCIGKLNTDMIAICRRHGITGQRREEVAEDFFSIEGGHTFDAINATNDLNGIENDFKFYVKGYIKAWQVKKEVNNG